MTSVTPAKRGSRILVGGALVDSFGNGLFMAASTLYFVGVVEFPATHVAAVLSLAAVFGLASPLPVGHAADRYGALRVYLVLICIRSAGYGAYAFVQEFSGYAVLTCLLCAADRASSPLLQVIVAKVAGDEERTRALASIRAVRNAGLTAGLLAAGAALGLDVPFAFQAVFLVNAASFLVIAGMTRWAVRVADVPAGPSPAADRATVQAPYRNVRFMVFTAANGVLSLYDSLLLVLLPIWLVQRTGLPHAWLSVLLAVNTVLTILLQAYLHRFATTVRGSLRLLKVTAVALCLSCGLFALAEEVPRWVAFGLAAAAVVALTVGENLHSVASWELSYALAPEAARARYLATFSMGMTGQRIVGPALLVGVLLPLHLWAWAVAAALFVAATAVALWSGRPAATAGTTDTATGTHDRASAVGTAHTDDPSGAAGATRTTGPAAATPHQE
ncbi:MFS transporter [Streptomyces sp. NPDC001920]